MKLYLVFALAFAAVQMSLSDDTNKTYRCPRTSPAVTCPHTDAVRCLAYCSFIKSREVQSNKDKHICSNSVPPMICPSSELSYCKKYCQSAAKDEGLESTMGPYQTNQDIMGVIVNPK